MAGTIQCGLTANTEPWLSSRSTKGFRNVKKNPAHPHAGLAQRRLSWRMADSEQRDLEPHCCLRCRKLTEGQSYTAKSRMHIMHGALPACSTRVEDISDAIIIGVPIAGVENWQGHPSTAQKCEIPRYYTPYYRDLFP